MRNTPNALKSVLIISSVAGRIPFIPQFVKAARGNEILANFYATIGMISFSPEYIWSSIKLVDSAIVEIESSETSKASCSEKACRVAALPLSIILGAGAQVPLLALAWYYNKKMPYIVLLNATDMIMPILSMRLLFQSKIPILFSNKTTKALHSIKTEIAQNILSKRMQYLRDSDTRADLETILNTSTPGYNEEKNLKQLIRFIMQPPLTEATSKTGLESCFHYLKTPSQVTGGALTVANLLWMGLFAHQGMSELTSNQAAIWAVSSFVVICNAMLLGTLLVQTTAQGTESLGSLMSCKYSKTFASEELCPRISGTAKVMCMGLAFFTYIASQQVSYDYLPPPYQLPSAIILSVSYILLSYYPVRELSDWTIIEGLQKFGSPEQKKALKTCQKLLKLSEYVESCSLKSTAKFLLANRDIDLLAAKCKEHDINEEELLAFSITTGKPY